MIPIFIPQTSLVEFVTIRQSFVDHLVASAGGTLAVQLRFSFMKHWILVLLLSIAHTSGLRAKPFEKAEVTRAINIVSLLPEDNPPEPAEPGDVIKGKTALKTGGDSRAELEFPDLTITRLGLQFALPVYRGRT